MIYCPRCESGIFQVTVSTTDIVVTCAECGRNIGYTVTIGQHGEEITEYEVPES